VRRYGSKINRLCEWVDSVALFTKKTTSLSTEAPGEPFVAQYLHAARDLLDRLALDQMLAPYPADRLYYQHPPPPTSTEAGSPEFGVPIPPLRGSIGANSQTDGSQDWMPERTFMAARPETASSCSHPRTFDTKSVHQPVESAECRPINGRGLRHLAQHISDSSAAFANPNRQEQQSWREFIGA
jgi:hypothetical protein